MGALLVNWAGCGRFEAKVFIEGDGTRRAGESNAPYRQGAQVDGAWSERWNGAWSGFEMAPGAKGGTVPGASRIGMNHESHKWTRMGEQLLCRCCWRAHGCAIG